MTHGTKRRGAPAAGSRSGMRMGVLVLGVLALAAAGWGEQAPRRPPQPFAVFIEASEPDDAELAARIQEAIPAVRERVQRRRNWFRLVESREAADLTLRVTNYRIAQTMRPKLETLYINGSPQLVERSEVIESHYVDAVAIAGEVLGLLTGLDERDRGARLRNAASHLAEELEALCKDKYAELTAPG